MKWFNDLKVRTKLIIGFSLVVFLAIILAVVTLTSVQEMRTMQDEGARRADAAVDADHARRVPYKMYMIIADAELNRNLQETAKNWSAVIKEWDDLLVMLTKESDTDQERVWIQQTKDEIGKAILTFENQMLPLLKQPKSVQNDIVLLKYDAQIDEILINGQKPLRDYADSLTKEMAAADEEFDALANKVFLTGIILTSVIVVLAIFIGLFIASLISKQLNKGVDFAMAVAGGDLTQRLDIDQKDEVGKLANALNEMVEKIKEIIESVQAAADNVTSGSQELSSSSEQMSQGATEQAAAAEEASSSMEQMTSNIKQNADNAQQTEKIALKSSADAKEGGKAVTETAEAMKEIAGKISIIEEIARQTNLLALNAAIEAARAGEHGKGFAVVASEVRKLAERSQTAAAEINKLSASSIKVAEKAGELLTKIVPDIQRTSELVQEITASSNEQNSGAEQINGAIQQLNQVIQQNASAAEEMSSTAEELTSQAELLQDTISFFRIDVRQSVHSVRKANTAQQRSHHLNLEPHRTFKPEHPAPVKNLSLKPGNGASKKNIKPSGVNIDLGNKEDKLDYEFEKF